jgi:UDP-glucose 4-epimerase
VRVTVTGASGNTGTSLLSVLAREPAVGSVLGVARRAPTQPWPKTDWAQADMARDDLVPLLRGSDAVVHLAWRFQPERRPDVLWRINVDGTRRVLEAVAAAEIGVLVVASSVAAYAPAEGKPAVPESWPATGVTSSLYSRAKAAVEALLDGFAAAHPQVRVVRVRPGLVFKRAAAAHLRRTFLGPFVPGRLLRPELLRVVPDIAGLAVQAVHADDLAEAYRAALVSEVQGAFNVAAEPVLTPSRMAERLGARTVPTSPDVARRAFATAWRLRLEPTEPAWLDLGLRLPLMDTGRARDELGWVPQHAADDAALEVLAGLRGGDGAPTPPLAPHAGGPLRIRELFSSGGADGAA